tara:strand:- start:306 stop:410 length:105 start_codon:yes stop_codon:yes gene_type:complete
MLPQDFARGGVHSDYQIFNEEDQLILTIDIDHNG